MKTAGFILAAALALGSGCAQKDWIDRTLVTVDVTGTWFGRDRVGGSGFAGDVFLALEQQGSRVKGSIQSRGLVGLITGSIDGTVAGDVFRFRATRGDVEGEVTVSGDEMAGQMTWGTMGSRPISLQRVDPSTRTGSPPR